MYLETLRRRGRVGRFVGRVTWSLGSVQGLFIAFMAFPLIVGTFLAVVVGAIYGPLAFLLLFGSIVGGLAFLVERKVGRSLQFGEYKFWKRALAQSAAFVLAVGLILFMLLLSRFRPF